MSAAPAGTGKRASAQARGTRWMRRPGVLLPYQKRWVEDTARVKVCEKGRRVGLSWCEAGEDALLAAASPEAGGMDVYYIGYNREMAREFIDDCADWARHYALAAGDLGEFLFADTDQDGAKRGIQAFRIGFASGFKIVALSSRPRSLRGIQGKIVIDEAAFHDDLAGLLKAALAMLVWGGRVVVISTHNGEDNPFNDLVQEVRAGRRPYSVHRIDLDQALEQGLYRRICDKLGRVWTAAAEAAWRAEIVEFYRPNEDEELFCIPARGGGAYLPRAMIERCMRADIPVIRLSQPDSFAELPGHAREAEIGDWLARELAPLLASLPGDCSHVFGEDFGRSGDLTVIWVFIVDRQLTRRTPFVVELANVPFEQQRKILFYIVGNLPNFGGGAVDATGNGAYLAEVAWQRYGAGLIAPVKLSAEWYPDTMPRYKAAFEDGALTLPKDADILDDHRAIVMERGVPRVPEGARMRDSSGRSRHGDAAIAGALAWYASLRDFGPVAFRALGERRAGAQAFDQSAAMIDPARGYGRVVGGNDFRGF